MSEASVIHVEQSGVSHAELLRFQAFNAKAIEEVQKGNPGKALEHLEEALGILDDPAVRSNYGDALARCGRLEEAMHAFRAAIAMKADYAQAHYNLGVVLDQMDRWDEAREAYLASLEHRVTPEALNNCAIVEHNTLRLEQAERHYRAAVKHGYDKARWNLSLLRMMQGDFREGWDLYEWRPQMDEWRNHPQKWRGEKVRGKVLVVLTEQGLGDSVYALRFLPMLRDLGARLVVGCEPAMRRMVEAVCPHREDAPDVRIFDRTREGYQNFDYMTLAMSIPGYLTPEGPGPSAPYVRVPGMNFGDDFKVGLCWNGSTIVGPPKERNIALKLLAPLSEVPGVKLYSLQKGEAASEMETCGFEVVDAMRTAKDVFDTARVIAGMDLVVTVDTLIPHLSGAIGKPTWLMNRFMSCWQWGTPAFDPVLYDSVAQFRQPKAREWASVVEHVAYGLRKIVEARREK